MNFARLLSLPLATFLFACASAPPAVQAPPQPGAAAADPSASPAGSEGGAAASIDPFIAAAPFLEENLAPSEPPAMDPALVLPPRPAAVPKAPSMCDAYVSRKPSAAPACADIDASRVALDAALAVSDEASRDAQLAALEACAGMPAGLVRALRIDFAPSACADVMAAPLLAKPPAAMRGDVQQTLVGQALGARLGRMAGDAPKLAGSADKARVVAYTRGPLLTWMTAQATAVQDMSAIGAKLSGYGRAILATEAGVADMRLVEAVRAVTVPDVIAKDEELKNAYYAALDVALDPRKDRGRDAALVGLRDFSALGAIEDRHVETARGLLSRLYGGRRIDALDGLLLPPLAKADAASVETRLAAKLPTFYAGILLDASRVLDPALLRALLSRGLPTPHRKALRAEALSPELTQLAARGRIALGQKYWDAFDFDEAARALSGLSAEARGDDGSLLLGLAIALRGGPKDAATMMHLAPVLAIGMGNVAALDALAARDPKGALAGRAAWDAAVIMQIATPEGATASYFRDLARRYDEAAALLTDPNEKAAATARARGAEEVAAAIR